MSALTPFRAARRWIESSIHRRLVVWSIGFWVISLSLLSLTVILVGQERMVREMSQRNTQLASVISRDINAKVSAISSDVRLFARHLEEVGPALNGQAAALLSLAQASPKRYRAAYYFDNGGKLLFNINNLPGTGAGLKPEELIASPPAAAPDEVAAAYRQVAQGVSLSAVSFVGIERVPVIYVSTQLNFVPAGRSAVVLEVDLSDVWQSIDLISIGQSGFAYLTSRNGIILAHPDAVYIGRQLPSQLAPLLSGYEGYREIFEPYLEKPVLVAFSPVGGQLGWGVVIQQDRAEANAPLAQTGIIIGAAWLVLAVAGTASILVLMRNFTAPLEKLTGTVQGIARTGDLARAPVVTTPDEVGQLGQAFSQMIDRIRAAETNLSASEEKYRSLFENANDAILILKDYVIVQCNSKAEKMFARSRDQIIGHTPDEFSPGQQPDGADSRAGLKVLVDRTLAGVPQVFEWEHLKSDGTRFDAEVSLNRISLSGGFSVIAIVRDVTERKRAQEELQKAAQSERTRLARDLHDAVSQTLFSASIIADVLPRLWERNREEARKRLEEVRQLTRGALAEMRTLLFELRPAALENAELGELLKHLTDSVTGRARVPVALEISGECSLAAEVKVALYRIAQEALNNVAKHSGATQATVKLDCQPGQVALQIVDNGKGFDPGDTRTGSLGLGIMRERAVKINASLDVSSKPGQGTEITVIWTDRREVCTYEK